MNLRKLFIAVSNKHDLYYRVVLVSLSVLLMTTLLPRQVRFKYNYTPGQPWTYADLRAPFTFPLIKPSGVLDAERDAITANAPVFYRRDTLASLRAAEAFSRRFADVSAQEKATILRVLDEVYAIGILDTSRSPKLTTARPVYCIDGVQIRKRDASTFLRLQDVPLFLKSRMQDVDAVAADNLLREAKALLLPDLTYDEAMTLEHTRGLMGSISPVRGEMREGSILVRRGQVVGPEEFLRLESLKAAFKVNTVSAYTGFWLYVGYLLIVVAAVSILLVFLWLLRKDILLDSRKITLLMLLMVSAVGVSALLMESGRVSMLLLPLCILPLVTRAFFDTRTALFTHVLSILILGTVAPGGFDFVFMQIIAGMIAIFSIVNMRKRSQLFMAVSLIFVGYLVSFTGLSLLNEGDIAKINPSQLVWLLANCLLTLLSYPLIFFIEKTFRVTSDFTLMELTDFNSELLRELGLKAPGTFQHSLQVANLAEAAIYKIGGNSLLVRVGALYHDIGKMDMPMYFIENQSTQVNPHDELSFDESASIIIGHVIRGIEKAKKYHLPDVVIDFIRTHHGTMMVQYFYNKFIKSFPDQLPNEDDFRYPGPKPFSRETAVLMMADSVEAAARSLSVHDQDSIDQLVENIIDKQIDSGQFENCDITFRDLASIKKIFKKMLTSIYHVRLSYNN
jgi:putative nucleotidyltransferase with HDIG domain